MATAFAEIVSGEIIRIILNNRGVDYTTAVVTISGGNGIGGEAFLPQLIQEMVQSEVFSLIQMVIDKLLMIIWFNRL